MAQQQSSTQSFNIQELLNVRAERNFENTSAVTVQSVYKITAHIDALYKEFRNIAHTGTKALSLPLLQELTAPNVVPNDFVSAIPLQERFPPKEVILRVTKSCDKLESIVDGWLGSATYSQGIVGPTGLGKSYSFLFCYLQLRKFTDNYVILYFNNPALLCSSPANVSKELVFCFGRFLIQIVKEGLKFGDFPFKDLNYWQEFDTLKKFSYPPLTNTYELTKFLWVVYVFLNTDHNLDKGLLTDILVRLRYFCRSRGLAFFCLFDQFNVLYRPRLQFKNVKEWRNMVLEKSGCFDKVLWMASQNNSFRSTHGHKVEQFICFYSKDDLQLALDEFVVSVTDVNEKENYWKANNAKIIKSLKAYTNRNPLAVSEILNSPGSNITEKWNCYRKRKVRKMLRRFGNFSKRKMFKEDIFYSILPIVDYSGEIDSYLNRSILLDAFHYEIPEDINAETVAHVIPGAIDWGMMYYNESKGKFFSLTPVSKLVLNRLMYFKKIQNTRKAIQDGYIDENFNNPALKGILYEQMVLLGLLSRRELYFFDMIYRRQSRIGVENNLAFEFTCKFITSKRCFAYILKKALVTCSDNLYKNGRQDSPYIGILLLPLLHNFPLVDYMIFIPFFFESCKTVKAKGSEVKSPEQKKGKEKIGVRKSLRLQGKGKEKKQEMDIEMKNENNPENEVLEQDKHLLLLYQATTNVRRHKYKGMFSDIAVRDHKCPKFNSYMRLLPKIPGVRTQFIWVTRNIDFNFTTIGCDQNSWFMSDTDFNHILKVPIADPNSEE